MDDASGPRRFSINTALLPQISKDIPGRKPSYAAAPSESDPLLGTIGEGEIEEATSVGKESRLLFKYSLPLTLTYLLQVCSVLQFFNLASTSSEILKELGIYVLGNLGKLLNQAGLIMS